MRDVQPPDWKITKGVVITCVIMAVITTALLTAAIIYH